MTIITILSSHHDQQQTITRDDSLRRPLTCCRRLVPLPEVPNSKRLDAAISPAKMREITMKWGELVIKNWDWTINKCDLTRKLGPSHLMGLRIKPRDFSNDFMDLGLFEKRWYPKMTILWLLINNHILGDLSFGQTLLSTDAAHLSFQMHMTNNDQWGMYVCICNVM